ncbi:kinesin-associated protein-domain-containing protein [Fimicolochytrium jonesii]|uniref:kinesin-associated protein-domain-containing protein n=1 Tax=Fimicolochytrium jonesii TaxID=1396493 RepID=UPI0022FF2775|nr:kinesin-associated protein-domain-containing protein [Fimicolochytrium jonesii]KAI8818255.1 kinesin-associated protein-domain-containing protein [Fimicolochytrium jonesii]
MMSGQDDAESYQLKKKVIPGHIDVHPTDNAIIVNYTVQASILGESGQPVAGDRKNLQKIIRVKTLTPSSNLTAIAHEVVDKCKLIHPSKVVEVEQVLYYLLQRKGSQDDDGISDREWLRKQLEEQKREEDHPQLAQTKQEASSMSNIDSYIEGLYEEIPEKTIATRNVMELSRDPQNLEALASNDALISALSRVLREDGRKSIALNTNIISVFYAFSQYPQYHPIITTHKVGDMCLRVVEMEIRRFSIWIEDVRAVEKKVADKPGDKTLVAELDQENRKFQAMLQKQDQLLLVSFHLLLNLANDLTIEPKMVKRGIIRHLVEMLGRQTPELVTVVITFLKKLSIVAENKEEIIELEDSFLPRLDQLMPSEHHALQHSLLRFLLNLSHDVRFRTQLHRHHFVPRLFSVLQATSTGTSMALKRQMTPTLLLLYMMTLEDKGRVAFADSEKTRLILQLLLSQPTGPNAPDRLPLMALSINLAYQPRTAPFLMADKSLKFLMKRLMKTRDPLMWKLLRAMASSCGNEGRMAFLDYIDDIMHLLFKSTTQPDSLVEILGLLASLTIPDFDFTKLAEAYNLLGFIQTRLQSAINDVANAANAEPNVDAEMLGAGLSEDDDITLEVVNLLGTMASDENIGPVVAKTHIPQTLMELMIAKEDDDEMILQIIYCAYQFLLIESTRIVFLDETQIVSYLIDLLYDRNVEIRRMCDVCLDIISETDEEYLVKIRHQKFHYHNSEWMHRMAQSTASASQHGLFLETAGFEHQEQLRKYVGERRGAIFETNEGGWSDSDSDGDDQDDFGMVGGNNALLDGF